MSTEAISMSFSVSDNYSQHLAVVLASILVNNPDSLFRFHVLHRNITPESQARIGKVESQHPHCRVVFHHVDQSRFAAFPIPPMLEHVTQEMYYRYILPDVLADEDRTIYSDVDVLCVGDLRPLWEIDLAGNVIAAVPDNEAELAEQKWRYLGQSPGDYFCSGLLVMDLGVMRAEDFTQKLFRATSEFAPLLSWPDQDVINMVFRGRILAIPDMWNCASGYNPLRRDVRQWHFQSFTQKPWCNIWKNVTWIPYLKYLLMSPYRANALKFVLGHVAGFFYFRYTKKRVTRYLVCGVRVWKRREAE